MKTMAWLSVGVLAMAAVGCDSEVVGGGGGAGGAGGSSSETTSSSDTSSSTESSSASTGTGGSSGSESTSVQSASSGGGEGGGGQGGSGGAGGGNTLGTCEAESGTSGQSGGGTTECESTYACEGGAVEVSCSDDGTTERCACFLDGALEGECINDESQGCSFPQSCCHALLGGEAEPNPGPYGACEADGGSTAQSGGGETACGATYTCDGGDLMIDCSGDAGGATCECRDGQGFLLATCEQDAVDCDYGASCCFALVN